MGMTESERKLAKAMRYANIHYGFPVEKWAHMTRKERKFYKRMMLRKIAAEEEQARDGQR